MSIRKDRTLFNIDKSDWTICYATEPVPVAEGVFNFSTEAALANVADVQQWSREDLEACWNSFAGAVPFDDCKPTKKFKNRPYAIRQIWNAIQRLAPEGERKPTLEAVLREKKTPKPKAENRPNPKKKAAKKAAAKPKAKKTAAKKAAKPKAERTPRKKGESKKDQAAKLSLRKSGVTAAELQERLGWNEGSTTMFFQWVRIVTDAGIRSLSITKNASGEKVFRARGIEIES